MAGAVVAVVATAVVNAVAFSGSNYIFSHFDKSTAAEDARRRQEAIDKYNREKDAYNENLRLRNEFLATRKQQQSESEQTFQDVSADLEEYYRISGLDESYFKEPKIEYIPSDTQAELELGFQLVGTICAVIGAYMLF